MAIKRDFTTGEKFLENVNDTMGTDLKADATPQMLLNAFKVASEAASYNKTDDNVLNTINDAAASTVKELEGLTYIYVQTYPNKMNYVVGEYLDPNGIIVIGQFEDGTERALIPDKEYKVGEGTAVLYALNKYQITYATQAYAEIYARNSEDYLSAYFGGALTVVDTDNSAFLTRVSVNTKPYKTQYVAGENLNLSNLSISVEYSTHNIETIWQWEFSSKVNYIDPSPLSVEDYIVTFTPSDYYNNPLNLSADLYITVTAEATAPLVNFYQASSSSNVVFADGHVYNFVTDYDGVITRFMTDGTSYIEDITDGTFGSNFDDYALSGPSQQNIAILKYHDENHEMYEVIGNYPILIDTAEVVGLFTGVSGTVGAGDYLTKDKLWGSVHYRGLNTGASVSGNLIKDNVTLTVTNPLSVGQNNYTVLYSYTDPYDHTSSATFNGQLTVASFPAQVSVNYGSGISGTAKLLYYYNSTAQVSDITSTAVVIADSGSQFTILFSDINATESSTAISINDGTAFNPGTVSEPVNGYYVDGNAVVINSMSTGQISITLN